jgi:hypothetical protein
MPTLITGPPPGTKTKPRPRPRGGAAVEAEVATIRAELFRHAWVVEERVYRDARNRPVFLLEARWSGSSTRVRAESPDRASAWREVLRKAGKLGLLGPESRPPGFRYRRPDRGPRVISFTDLGWNPSS